MNQMRSQREDLPRYRSMENYDPTSAEGLVRSVSPVINSSKNGKVTDRETLQKLLQDMIGPASRRQQNTKNRMKSRDRNPHDSSTWNDDEVWNSTENYPILDLYLDGESRELIYPDERLNMATTTHDTFRGMPGMRSDMMKPFDGSLRAEGSMAFETTTRSTYRAPMNVQKPPARLELPPLNATSRGRFFGETQSMRDFPGFRDGQPPPPDPASPAPDNLHLPPHGVSRTFETEQREQFRGVDPALHPPPKPVEKREDALKPSSAAAYEMQSTHRAAYRPIKLDQQIVNPVDRGERSEAILLSKARFDGTTTNDLFFQPIAMTSRSRQESKMTSRNRHDDASVTDNWMTSVSTGARVGSDGGDILQNRNVLKDLRCRKFNPESVSSSVELGFDHGSPGNCCSPRELGRFDPARSLGSKPMQVGKNNGKNNADKNYTPPDHLHAGKLAGKAPDDEREGRLEGLDRERLEYDPGTDRSGKLFGWNQNLDDQTTRQTHVKRAAAAGHVVDVAGGEDVKRQTRKSRKEYNHRIRLQDKIARNDFVKFRRRKPDMFA